MFLFIHLAAKMWERTVLNHLHVIRQRFASPLCVTSCLDQCLSHYCQLSNSISQCFQRKLIMNVLLYWGKWLYKVSFLIKTNQKQVQQINITSAHKCAGLPSGKRSLPPGARDQWGLDTLVNGCKHPRDQIISQGVANGQKDLKKTTL